MQITEPGHRLLKSKLMWIGFAIAAGISIVNGLQRALSVRAVYPGEDVGHLAHVHEQALERDRLDARSRSTPTASGWGSCCRWTCCSRAGSSS